eukprot:m.65731 g.65731  ORF g.65731 m.65731 type:complete len:339 (+) comp8312_c1_seq1:184-1200(+)
MSKRLLAPGWTSVYLCLIMVLTRLNVCGGTGNLPTSDNLEPRAAVVLTAPPRMKGEPGPYTQGSWGPRLCLFLHAIHSVDVHLNQALNTHYPIFVIVASDHHLDPDDGPYTAQDRALIRSWAPHSNVTFVAVEFYSGRALPVGVTPDHVARWNQGLDGGVKGRPIGYRSMCRLWSGRLQRMDFLDGFDMYMRLDDDSFFTADVPRDPFVALNDANADYGYIRKSPDPHGIDALRALVQPDRLPRSTTNAIYTNFHIARVAVFRSGKFQRLWHKAEKARVFMKHRVGDALWHQMLVDIGLVAKATVMKWVPYAHNVNDFPGYPPKHWQAECQGGAPPRS